MLRHRGFLLAMALGAAALAPIAAHAAPIGTLQFQLDSLTIEKTRAAFTDTDWVAIKAYVNGEQRAEYARFLGDWRGGSHDVSASVEVTGVDSSDQVMFTWLVTNGGGSSTEETLNALSDAGAFIATLALPAYGKVWGYVNDIHHKIHRILTGWCNGVVIADRSKGSGQAFADLTAGGSHSERRFYAGTDSGFGCGANSKYWAAFTISRF